MAQLPPGAAPPSMDMFAAMMGGDPSVILRAIFEQMPDDDLDQLEAILADVRAARRG